MYGVIDLIYASLSKVTCKAGKAVFFPVVLWSIKKILSDDLYFLISFSKALPLFTSYASDIFDILLTFTSPLSVSISIFSK